MWDELNQLKVVSVCAGAQADSVGSCAEAKATRPTRGRNKLARERIVNVMVFAIGKRIEMFRLISLVVQYSWLSRKVPTQVDIYNVYSCSMNLASVAPSGCRQKKSTSTCLAKEATSCEYGLGMRKCW